jgi:polysaccharide pyruvyl transferase
MRFGLISYQTDNIGDDIQSIAVRKFVPRINQYIDRERLNEPSPDGAPVKLILSGWFCHRPDKWPPAAYIEPLLISMHITNNPEPGSGMRAREEFARNPRALEYLDRHGPVGARDHFTLDWLRSHGIACYYSGCLTLTLDRPSVPREPFIALNDVPEAVAVRIAGATDKHICRTTHTVATPASTESRFNDAAALIELYARACCLVTTRLHGALPCLAMGTPVLLIDDSWDQSRFTGLNELVHHCTAAQFLSGTMDYDVDNPPPNPHRHGKLREELERKVSAFIGR